MANSDKEIFLIQSNAALVTAILILLTFQSTEINSIHELTIKKELLENQLEQLQNMNQENEEQFTNTINEIQVEIIKIDSNIDTLQNKSPFSHDQFIINPSIFAGILITPFLISVSFAVMSWQKRSELMFIAGIALLLAFVVRGMII